MKNQFIKNLTFLLALGALVGLYIFCFNTSILRAYKNCKKKNTILLLRDVSFFLIYEEVTCVLKDLTREELFFFGAMGIFFVLGYTFIYFKSKKIAALDRFCFKIQKFCFENQLLIFSVVMFFIFLVSLLEMSLISSIVGLACVFNAMRFFNFLHKENIFYLEALIFTVICYRYVTNPSAINYAFCLIFLWYIWSVISVISPIPTVEETFNKFREELRPSLKHMEVEFYLFFILERVVFFYLTIRVSLGGSGLCCAIGSDLHVILSYYMYASFVVCVLARLLTAVAFNPLTAKQTQLGILCAACGSWMLGVDSYLGDVHTKATSGGSTMPLPNAFTRHYQLKAFGCTAVTGQEVDAAKMYVAVYNRTPPTIPGTDRISLDETLRTLEEEASPTVKHKISRYRGTNFGPSTLTEDQIVSAVKRGLQAEHGGSKDAGSTQEGALVKAIKDAIGEQEGGTSAAPAEQNKKGFVKKGIGRWEAEEKASTMVKKSIVVDPACNSAGVQKDQGFAKKNWKQDMISEAMKDFKPPKGEGGSTKP